MRLCRIVLLFLPSALWLPSLAAAQAADTRTDAGTNAAVKYWQAFALLPTLDGDQEKIVQEWNKVPLDAAALKLLERSRNSLVSLHRGARLPHCDWGLEYADGIRMWIPHGPKALTLSRLAALHARHEFEQGHGKAGWEDVTALLKLARHVEQDRVMIIQLVAYRIETTAIEAAAPYLPELKSVLPASAAALVDNLPPAPTSAQLLIAERQLGPVWLIQELKAAEQRKAGSWQDVWQEIFGHQENPADRDLARAAKSFEQTVKMLEDLLPYYDQLAKMTTLPSKEFDAEYREFVKKVKADNPLAGYILPSMDRVIAAQRRTQAQLALFKAALAFVQGGTDKLQEIKDPFGDGPFEYRAQDRGFELKSKLLYKGQAVTLVVGRK